MKISPLVLNHLARTTFCWLPPERFTTRVRESVVLMFSVLTYLSPVPHVLRGQHDEAAHVHQVGDGDVLRDRLRQEQARVLAVLGDEAHLVPDGRLRARRA